MAWRLALWAVRVLGRRGTYAMASVVAFSLSWFLPGPRRALHRYLKIAKPQAGDLRRAFDVSSIIVNFGLAIADRLLVLTRGPGDFTISREGVEDVMAAIPEGEGFILLTAHLGNADFGAAALNTRGDRRVNVLQYAAEHDPFMEIVRQISGDRGPKIIALNHQSSRAGVLAGRALRGGEVVALKADRVVDERAADVMLLGRRAKIPTGPFLLAAVSRAPVVVMGCFKTSATHYHLEILPPRTYRFRSRTERDACLQEWAQDYADQLSEWARRYPTQWYNFHDLWV